MSRVDIAIIGAGPAGISAAINAKIRNKSFILFGSDSLSLKVDISKQIDNYIGFPCTSGKELNEKFKAHMQNLDISVTNEQITGIYNKGDYFILLADLKQFEASSVIIATGAETAKPIEGEREFLGRGVSYCATCDGNLFKGKTIAVFCDSPEEEAEAIYLSEIAGKVYYCPNFKSGLERENIIKLDSKIKAVLGDSLVREIELKNGEKIKIDGIFFIKQSVAADILLRKLKTENGSIVVDRNMKTSVDGCFAAGDCTGAPYQLAKAVGEGNIALHSAISYLAKMEEK